MILKGDVLGRVNHYFYQKEYQARGAPHYHMILWIDGAATVGDDEPEVVLQWIQERITCRILEENINPELHQLVGHKSPSPTKTLVFLVSPNCQ